jgi:branched-chain amino acid transport system ATP-binding protein
MSVVLETRDARVHFGGVKAVDGVSIAVEQGRLHGLVGPNGSGKSTLLAALSGLINLTSGTVKFAESEYGDGNVSASAIARLGIGRTFQAVRLVASLNTLENVMLGADVRIFGRSLLSSWFLPARSNRCEREARDAAWHALERLALRDVAMMDPSALPYGTRRRIEIARALCSQPTLLLLDEPTAGMTRAERIELADVLTSLRSQGLTQVIVEHDMPLITSICDDITVLALGKVIASGDPAEVVQLAAVQKAYLGTEGVNVSA